MFQFTGFASSPLCIQDGILLAEWVSPFGHLWIKASLPAPQSFSQACTSFFACNRQGIHHMHLFASSYNFKLSCEICSSQATHSCDNFLAVRSCLLMQSQPYHWPLLAL